MLRKVRRARSSLLKNIHIVLSVLLHAGVGVFFLLNVSEDMVPYGPQDPMVSIEDSAIGEQNAVPSQDALPQEEKGKIVPPLQQQPNKDEGMVEHETMVQEPHHMQNELKKKYTQQPTQPPAGDNAPKQELSNVLKAMQETKSAVLPPQQYEDNVIGGSPSYNIKQDRTAVIVESIKSKFVSCWTVPSGAKTAKNTQVRVNLMLAPSGKVIRAQVLDMQSYDLDPLSRAITDSALRAVYKCSPLRGLSRTDYSIWKNVVLTFNPKPAL